MNAIAIVPSSRFVIVIAMFMPTLNASRSVCEVPRPRKSSSVRPCFVPAPPGVAGKSVASESTTSAISALWIVAVTANASQEEVQRRDAEEPRDGLRRHHRANEPRPVVQDREAEPHLLAQAVDARPRDQPADDREHEENAEPVQRVSLVPQEEPPVDVGMREYTWCAGRTPVASAQTMMIAAVTASKSVSTISVGVSVA